MKPKAYTACRSSGIDWIGDLPKDWQIMRLKWIFRTLNGSTPKSSEPNYWDGEIPWATPDDLGSLRGDTLIETRRSITDAGYNSCGTSIAPIGSIILSTRAPIGHLAIAGKAMCANQGCKILAFKNSDNRRFFYYQLIAARPELQSFGQGSTFKELAGSKLNSIPLVLPTLDEQHSISAFLDRKTEKIDGLIAKKERLIELLHEKRAALINHAVTKGLDPSVPMKDSGLEWIGEIPAHWDVLPFKYVTNRVDVGIAEATAHAYADEGVPIIRSTNVKPNNLDLNDIFYIEKWFAEKNRSKYLNKGDIVTVRTGNAGISAVVPPSLHKSQCFTMLISTLCKHQLAEFYCFYFNAIPGQTVFKLEGWGTAQINISVPILKNLTVVSPQYEEQQKIVSYLENQTARIDSILSKIYEAIKKLKEYRTALISSAVTGKIDVRQEVA